MESILRKHGFKIILLIAILIMAIFIASNLLNNSEQKFPLKEETTDFSLENLQGNPVSLTDHEGKVRLLYFYFSHCPDVCLPTTHVLSRVQERLKEEEQFSEEAVLISVTFDPVRDTRERLLDYSARYQADPEGWLFLRGEEEYTREVATEYGVAVIEVDGGSFAHTNVIFLIDQKGYIRKYYNANDLERDPADFADEIAKDISDLL